MNKFFANRITNIEPFYVMALLKRAKELEASGHDIIHMEIGEPDFPTAPTIVNAASQWLQSGHVNYTAASGLPELRQKLAAFYQTRYGIKLCPERIFITPGASGAFLLAFSLTINPDDEVLMADPCYPCNSNFLRLFGAKAKTIPADAQTNYQLTANLIERNWSKSSKGVLIASPSNPTGTLIDKGELKNAIHLTEILGGLFYSDEIYHGLTYGSDAETALTFSDNAFIINSFSKYFGMTGWRLGWLVVPEVFIESAEKVAQNIFISAPTLSQYAALTALDSPTINELEIRRAEFSKRRDHLLSGLLDLGFKVPAKPEGAFYIYADCSPFTHNSYQFALNLLEAEGIAITPGKDFGHHHAAQYLRFAYTTTLERLSEALQRLERFIKTVR